LVRGRSKTWEAHLKKTLKNPTDGKKRLVNGCALCDHTYKVYHAHYGEIITSEAVKSACPECRSNQAAKPADKVHLKPETPPKGFELPKQRSPKENQPTIVVAGICPFPITDAKWSSLKTWAIKTRNYFKEKGQFLAVNALRNLVRHHLPGDFERQEKAVKRIDAMYRAEVTREHAELGGWIERRAKNPVVIAPEPPGIDDRRPDVPEPLRKPIVRLKRTGDDSLGKSEKTVLGVLTDAPQGWKAVKKACGLPKVLPTLKRLVVRGLATRTESGKFRIRVAGK
jgi:hypothetical protein